MGYDIFAGWGQQSAYDTSVPRTHFSRVFSDSDLRHLKPGEPRTHVGQLDAEELYYRQEAGSGRLVVPAAYKGLHVLLYNALGAQGADSGPGAQGEYTRVFTAPAVALPADGMTVELHKGFPDVGFESKIGTGMKVGQLAVAAAVNEEPRYDFQLIGKKVDLGAKTAAPTTEDLDVLGLSATQITVEIDASSAEVFSVEFTLDNNVREDRGFLGSQYIAEPVRAPGKRQLTGTISKEWSDKTLYDKFLAGSVASLRLHAVGPVIGGAVTFEHDWEIAKIRFVEPEEDTVEVDQIPQSLPFVAFWDATDTILKLTEITDETV